MTLNKKILLILFLLIVVVLTVIFFVSGSRAPSDSFPTPTPVENSGTGPDAAPGIDTTIEKDDKERQNQSSAVYSLVERLPYSGRNFTLYYNFSKDLFVLYINPSSKAEGDVEFEEFLKTNSIEREWFKNLFTTYLSPTPTPLKNTSPTPAP